MSLEGEYDDQNIFAKILRREASAIIVHEDDDTMTFMDVFPQSRGHVLIVPKSPARNILEIEDAPLQALIVQVKRVAKAVEKALNPDGVFIGQFNGAEAGQTVHHIHFHVIPRYKGRDMGRHGEDRADDEALKKLADDIGIALSELD